MARWRLLIQLDRRLPKPELLVSSPPVEECASETALLAAVGRHIYDPRVESISVERLGDVADAA